MHSECSDVAHLDKEVCKMLWFLYKHRGNNKHFKHSSLFCYNRPVTYNHWIEGLPFNFTVKPYLPSSKKFFLSLWISILWNPSYNRSNALHFLKQRDYSVYLSLASVVLDRPAGCWPLVLLFEDAVGSTFWPTPHPSQPPSATWACP